RRDNVHLDTGRAHALDAVGDEATRGITVEPRKRRRQDDDLHRAPLAGTGSRRAEPGSLLWSWAPAFRLSRDACRRARAPSTVPSGLTPSATSQERAAQARAVQT